MDNGGNLAGIIIGVIIGVVLIVVVAIVVAKFACKKTSSRVGSRVNVRSHAPPKNLHMNNSAVQQPPPYSNPAFQPQPYNNHLPPIEKTTADPAYPPPAYSQPGNQYNDSSAYTSQFGQDMYQKPTDPGAYPTTAGYPPPAGYGDTTANTGVAEPNPSLPPPPPYNTVS